MISSETLKPFEKSPWSFGNNVESLEEPLFEFMEWRHILKIGLLCWQRPYGPVFMY